MLGKAGPIEATKSHWPEIVGAYEMMRILDVKPTLDSLVSLLNKHFEDKHRHVKSGSEPGDLVNVVFLYQRPRESFNIIEPRLAPLLDFLTCKTAVSTIMKIFREYFFPLIKKHWDGSRGFGIALRAE